MPFSVAVTFNSPRFQDDPEQLYEQLRTMEVFEVDGISSVLKIFQNRQTFKVPMATANEHIDDSTGKLVIYVPRERRAQELCFASVLPRKLAAWLMRPLKSLIDVPVESEAIRALTSIFASGTSALDDILNDQGILDLSFENEDEGYNEEDEGVRQEHDEQQVNDQEDESQEQHSDNYLGADGTSSESQATPTHSSVNESASPHVDSSSSESEGSLTETPVETISRQSHLSYQPPSREVRHSPQPAVSQVPSQSPNRSGYRAAPNLPSVIAAQAENRSSEDARYRVILDRVVEKARRAAFPSRGSFNMSDMRNALPEGGDTSAHGSFDGLGVMGRFQSTSQLERDKKIGAAGELYVSGFPREARIYETD